jgi:hypothetical protein
MEKIMKKNLIIYIAIATITLSFAVNNYGQIGDWIKLGKDAIEKSKNKKKEKTENPQTKKEQTNNNGQSNGENGNGDKTPTGTATSNIGKIYFSNKPFTTNHDESKTSFTTSEYIYGRLELSGGTLRDVLKFSPINEENPEHKLLLDFFLYSGRQSLKEERFKNYNYVSASRYGGPIAILTEADLDKNYWNFDVLPEPAKATTKTYDKTLMEYSVPYKLYEYLKDNAEEQTYTIRIVLQKQTRDFRGKLENAEKWMTVEELATLDFKKTDYAKIKTDGDQMKANRIQRFQKDKEDAQNTETANEPLPEEWTLKSNPLLPGLTESSLKAMFLHNHPYWVQKQIIKLYAEPADSRERTVVSNDFGIPKYRYVRQKFTVFVKVVGEDKCFYQRFTPGQAYAGGGTFGNYYAILEDRVNISCTKIGVK